MIKPERYRTIYGKLNAKSEQQRTIYGKLNVCTDNKYNILSQACVSIPESLENQICSLASIQLFSYSR